MEEYFGKIEKRKQKVSSKEYIHWLYDYVSTNKNANNESALYTYKDIDAENGQILGAFLITLKNWQLNREFLLYQMKNAILVANK